MSPAVFFESSSSAGGILSLLLMTAGVLLGAIVYSLMKYPSLRRGQYQDTDGFGTPLSVGVALLVALIFVGIGGRIRWGRFDSAEVRGSVVVLNYAFPRSKVRLPASSVQSVGPYKIGRLGFAPRIETLGGDVYTGRSFQVGFLEEEIDAFREALK